MGGRFTLLLSLCSLPVCLNLPTTTHPLITWYSLLPPSLTVYFSSLHLSTPPLSLQLSSYPSILLSFTIASLFPKPSLTFSSSHTLSINLLNPVHLPFHTPSLISRPTQTLTSNCDIVYEKLTFNMTPVSMNKLILFC